VLKVVDHVFVIFTHKAIENGDQSTIEEWLQENDTRVNECRGGRAAFKHNAVSNGTALHWAVYYGQLEIAKQLLEKGAGNIYMVIAILQSLKPATITGSCFNYFRLDDVSDLL